MLVNKKKYYEYDELKKLVSSLNISTIEEYKKIFRELNKFGKKAPSNPYSFYGKDVFENWSVFLGKPINKKKHHGLYYSYDECKEVIKKIGIKSKSEFISSAKDLIIQDIGIPYNPYMVYKNEWEGWGTFLGTGRVQDNLKVYRPFEEAREWARSLNFKLHKEWRKLDVSSLPPDIPKNPSSTYKNKGWINYYDWIGVDKRTKMSYGEKIIQDFLTENDVEFIYNRSVKDCKNVSKLRFDFYLPQYNTCIEYDGIQHYKPVDAFGGGEEFKRTKERDKIKDEFCEENNIKLVRICYLTPIDEIEMLIIDIIKPIYEGE